MAITPLPAVPLRSDAPATFVAKADAFLGALNLFATEVDAVGVALTLGATNSTSTTSLLIGLGSKSLTVQTGKSYVVGMTVKIASTATGVDWMLGDITSYTTGTGALVVTVAGISGSGTLAAWTISQAASGGAKLGANADITSLSGLTTPLSVAQGGTGQNTPISTSRILPITASVAASALTCTLNTTVLDFRNTPLTSGTINTLSIASAISVTVPSGVTLATYSAQQSRLVLIALYNGGTPVLGVTSMAGGENLDETTLLTTTAIGTSCTFTGAIAVTTGILTLSATGTGTLAVGMALAGTGIPTGVGGPSTIYVKALLTGTLGAAASTYSTNTTLAVASTTLTGSAGTGVYSTAAVTASPFRVVGYVESTQATAGTWATAPSTIQGQGGQALAAMSSLGYGQTCQNVTGSRVLGTTYYNTTGKPIQISCRTTITAVNTVLTATVNSVVASDVQGNSTYEANKSISGVIVPIGGSYSFAITTGTGALIYWSELR